MPVLCARLLIDCSTLSAPCLEAELRLIHRSRAKSRRVRRSSSESGSGLNVHEELRSHHLERRGGANGDSWPVSGGCIHSLPVRSCRKIRGSKKKCLQKRGEFVPTCAWTTAPRAGSGLGEARPSPLPPRVTADDRNASPGVRADARQRGRFGSTTTRVLGD